MTTLQEKTAAFHTVRNDRPSRALISPKSSRATGILLVDDDESVRRLMHLALELDGLLVWSAAGGLEAIDLYQRHRDRIGVVLLDVRMPGLDGPQTLAALRGINPELHCCFMTGDPGPYTIEGLRQLGAVTVFIKPVPLHELTRCVCEITGSAARELAN